MFTQKSQYGLTLMVTRDAALTAYLNTVLQQMSGTCSAQRCSTAPRFLYCGRVFMLTHVSRLCLTRLFSTDWLLRGILQKIVLVISSVTSKEVLERWTFDIQTDDDAAAGKYAPASARLIIHLFKM